MRRVWMALALVAMATLAHASTPDANLLAHGVRDGDAPAWAIDVATPPGWTRDCCTYAKAIGVDAVLYRGEWTGKPEQVMVLNVWPRKLSTLADEVTADRKHYLQGDPAAKVTALPAGNPAMPCQGVLYQGTDHIDDAVVFCDPGRASGVRFSWSLTLAADDPAQAQLLALFRQVVAQSRYAVYREDAAAAKGSTAH